jgi:hypothetical protein
LSECAQYIFTDVSSVFFDSARKILKRYSGIVSYQTLDMGLRSMDQGFTAESINIVEASNFLHASRDIPAVLRNVRSLRPGDHLVCVELAGCLLIHTIIFGVLEGWWLGMEGIDLGRHPFQNGSGTITSKQQASQDLNALHQPQI